MILYNVTVNIEHGIASDWLHWMKTVHIPDVMATGLFVENKMWKVLVADDTGFTYSVQYTLENMANYNIYITQHAPDLQKDHLQRYGDKAIAFRTLLQFEHHHG